MSGEGECVYAMRVSVTTVGVCGGVVCSEGVNGKGESVSVSVSVEGECEH